MMYGYGNSMFLFSNGIIATPAANPLWDSLYAVYKAENNANDSLGVYNAMHINLVFYPVILYFLHFKLDSFKRIS